MTTEQAKRDLAATIKWLREEHGYPGDSMPRGDRDSGNCPLAIALRKCYPDKEEIWVGTTLWEWLKDFKRSVEPLPTFAIDFVHRFDHLQYPELLAPKEGVV